MMPLRPPSDPLPSAEHLFGQDIIIVSLSDWSGPKRIRQHLAEALVRKGNRVLFVEAQYTFVKFLKRPSLQRFFGFLGGPRQLKEHLSLLSAPPFIPGGEFFHGIARVNWISARYFIRRAIRKLGIQNPTLLIFAYNASPLVGTLDERLTLYFCNDAFHLLVPKALSRHVLEIERRLIAKVDAIFTVSDKLTREKNQHHANVHTIYHGVDVESFDSPEAMRVPADIPPTRPIIGYSGVLRDMLDVDLLEFVAVQRREWSLVLVGPRERGNRRFEEALNRLGTQENVFLLGPKPVGSIPSYLRSFDLCMIPYTQGEIATYYSAPLKFFEYLAAGKRVISTVGPRSYDNGVVINCTSREEFLAAISSALADDNEELVRRRISIARQNSWNARVQEMASFLSTLAPPR